MLKKTLEKGSVTYPITFFPSNGGQDIAQSAQEQCRDGRLLAEKCCQRQDNGEDQGSPLPVQHVPAVGQVAEQVANTSGQIRPAHQTRNCLRMNGMGGEKSAGGQDSNPGWQQSSSHQDHQPRGHAVEHYVDQVIAHGR